VAYTKDSDKFLKRTASAWVELAAGGGGGAPTTATYIVQVPDAGLSAEQALSLLSTGLTISTTGTGVITIYGGTSCTNQFPRSLDASGAATCASVATADVSNNAIDNTKLRDSAGFSVIGKATTGSGDPGDIVAGTDTVLGRIGSADLAFAQVATGQVANNAVTYAKMQDVTAASRLIGRGSAGGAGDPEEITLGLNLSMSGTTLKGMTLTNVEKDLGAAPLYSGTFDITGLSGLTVGANVLVMQAAGPYTGKGDQPDEAEMDQVTATGYVFDATTIRVYWTCQPYSGPVAGNVKFNYVVGG